jgi:hypothetical protein
MQTQSFVLVQSNIKLKTDDDLLHLTQQQKRSSIPIVLTNLFSVESIISHCCSIYIRVVCIAMHAKLQGTLTD